MDSQNENQTTISPPEDMTSGLVDQASSNMATLNEPEDTPISQTDENIARENSSISPNVESEDDDDFMDAEETLEESVAPTEGKIRADSYEAAYEEDPEDELAPFDGTIISHIISQARTSMDLTKITLPTFILERRSLLEMLADFLAHPDEFVNIADCSTPRERFIQVVKWYLSAFHAGRKSTVPKKPYNPILGEIFQCYYDIGLSSDRAGDRTKDGPVPWATENNVTFIAEQTSHHPPITSFYAECPAKHIEIEGCLWTKSRFLGLSIGVELVGDATLTLIDHDERYVMTFPGAYGRSILVVPWFEMGGRVSIKCEQTGYSATIDFLTKAFINGRKHQITGSLLGPDKKEFCKIDGEWNGVMNAKYSDTKVSEVFFDTKTTPVIKKIVRPIVEQEENESRRLWKDVTYHLKFKQMDKATDAKSFLENRQRQEAKERAANGVQWQTKYFIPSGERKWTYDNKLSKRLHQQS